MKMKRILSVLLAVMLLGALAAGCGGASKSTAQVEMAYDSAAPMGEYALESPAAGAMDNGSTADTTALPENRKWIITVDLTAETEDLDALRAGLDEKIGTFNGYIEDQSINNGSAYQSRRYRSTSLTIRIPADQVDAFLQDVGSLANVVRQNKRIEDVTLSYVSTENRLKALETEEARLLELMAQAESMSDLLEIEERLSEVRYELENYGSQKRLYDNQIDYATIYLSVEEVQEYTPVEEPTLWARIRDGFMENLSGVGDDLLDALVWLIVSIPYLVVLALIVLIVLWVVKRARRRRTAKKETTKPKNEE